MVFQSVITRGAVKTPLTTLLPTLVVKLVELDFCFCGRQAPDFSEARILKWLYAKPNPDLRYLLLAPMHLLI